MNGVKGLQEIRTSPSLEEVLKNIFPHEKNTRKEENFNAIQGGIGHKSSISLNKRNYVAKLEMIG